VATLRQYTQPYQSLTARGWVSQVVAHERPDLQEQAANLVATLGQYTITLTDLEDNLLRRLANSQVPTLQYTPGPSGH
jgi:hypothetical protein